jgi:hypothetical protein
MTTEPTDITAPPRRRGLLVLGIVLLAAGVGVTMLGIVEVQHMLRLRSASTHARATVTDDRISTSSKSGSRHQVRYRFSVKGRSYTFGDATGRKNLWASVEYHAWQKARESGHVDVVYDADHPSVNKPAKSEGLPTADAFAGVVFGLLVLFGGLACIRASGQPPKTKGGEGDALPDGTVVGSDQ